MSVHEFIYKLVPEIKEQLDAASNALQEASKEYEQLLEIAYENMYNSRNQHGA